MFLKNFIILSPYVADITYRKDYKIIMFVDDLGILIVEKILYTKNKISYFDWQGRF